MTGGRLYLLIIFSVLAPIVIFPSASVREIAAVMSAWITKTVPDEARRRN